MEVLGLAGFHVLAKRRQQRFAREAGLPLDLRPLEVRVFQVLRQGEYLTRAEIAERLGHATSCQRTALDNLVDRGLVRRSAKRTRKLGGKGRTAYEYWVPLEVFRQLAAQQRTRIA